MRAETGWLELVLDGLPRAKHHDVRRDPGCPPAGATPFRAETHHQFSPLRYPDPGDSLRVRCNPEKQTVEIDLSDDARFNPKIFRPANERKLKEEHDRLLHAPPGTPAPGGHGYIDDPELAELVRLEAEDLKREG